MKVCAARMAACSRGPAWASVTVCRYCHAVSWKPRGSRLLRRPAVSARSVVVQLGVGLGGGPGRGDAVEYAVEPRGVRAAPRRRSGG